MRKIDEATYLRFIRDALETEGVHTTDIANKLALEAESITIELYSAAARIIAAAYLAQ